VLTAGEARCYINHGKIPSFDRPNCAPRLVFVFWWLMGKSGIRPRPARRVQEGSEGTSPSLHARRATDGRACAPTICRLRSVHGELIFRRRSPTRHLRAKSLARRQRNGAQQRRAKALGPFDVRSIGDVSAARGFNQILSLTPPIFCPTPTSLVNSKLSQAALSTL